MKLQAKHDKLREKREALKKPGKREQMLYEKAKLSKSMSATEAYAKGRGAEYVESQKAKKKLNKQERNRLNKVDRLVEQMKQTGKALDQKQVMDRLNLPQDVVEEIMSYVV